jgi:hypothetical protein
MLSHKLINQIDQLRETFSTRIMEGNLDEKTPILVSAQSDQVRISAQLVDCDRLGYLLTGLEAQPRVGVECDKAQLEDQLGMLSGKITYLTEALTLVEKEADLSRALFRSAKPDKRADGIYYYELTLEPGKSIRLDRRCYDFATRRRKVVPFTIPKNVFERLVGDFAEMLCPSDEKVDVLPERFEIYPSSW